MSRVVRRPQAAEDIEEIWNYIASDDLPAADRWLDHLDESFQLLATHPSMGRAREELAAGVRSFPFGRYVIFYAQVERAIDVIRVLHSARDIGQRFGG